MSFTIVPSKMLEHIICITIMAHIDEHKLLSDRQHSFRKNLSCEIQFITVINDWAYSLDSGDQVDTFILNFEKAFDTPLHELLKCKHHGYGISGKHLVWIDSFLCNGKKRLVVNGVKSQCAPVLSSVPQDTVVGPLLFSLYINDIMVGVESEICLYTDDCICYRQIDSIEDTSKLQKDIDQLSKWVREWSMKFQPMKCNTVQHTRKRLKKINAVYSSEGTVL